MKSGWIIKYRDGGKLFMTEEAYKQHEKLKNVDDIACEEHWFDIEKMKEKYPFVK